MNATPHKNHPPLARAVVWCAGRKRKRSFLQVSPVAETGNATTNVPLPGDQGDGGVICSATPGFGEETGRNERSSHGDSAHRKDT